MKVYYEILPNTAASMRHGDYKASVDAGVNKLGALVVELGGSTDAKALVRSDGSVYGIQLPSRPDGWIEVKGSPGVYRPPRAKTHTAIRLRLEEINVGGGDRLARAMFESSKLYFSGGKRLLTGVGSDEAMGRVFIVFADSEHAKMYADTMPSGMVPVRASEVMRLKEDEASAQQTT
jgi:hypothetical protein